MDPQVGVSRDWDPEFWHPLCSTVHLSSLQHSQFLIRTSLVLAGGGKQKHQAPSEPKGRGWSEEKKRKEENGTHRANR